MRVCSQSNQNFRRVNCFVKIDFNLVASEGKVRAIIYFKFRAVLEVSFFFMASTPNSSNISHLRKSH